MKSHNVLTSLVLGVAFTCAGAFALAAGSSSTVYDAIPSPRPGNVPSLGPEAYSGKELGDKITLAPGDRTLERVDLMLSSWACETGSWNLGTCVTTPGATFTHPVTLNIYSADQSTLIGSVTQTFTIPYRPSADFLACGDGRWSLDGTNTNCFNGLAHVVAFDGAALSTITLPDTFVFGIAYDTTSHGYDPIGSDINDPRYQANKPYDSLNVGLSSSSNPSPSVGTDVTGADGLYWYTTHAPFYCDAGAGGLSFRLDYAAGCWAPNGGITIRFVTAPPVAAVNLTGFLHPVDSAPTLNRAKAGQSVPLKFYVTDPAGVPVTDLASVNVTIANVSCTSLVTSGDDPIEQYATGTSGLQNQGNGYYQWNWQTTKGTAGCRVLSLTLPDGYASTPSQLQAYFEFRK